MTVLLIFAFISGVITILSPCILPVLPIVLSAGSSGGKARPWGVILGFVASFTFFTLALSALVDAFKLSADSLRLVAIAVIGIFGLVLLIPFLRDQFEVFASKLASGFKTRGKGSGLGGGIALGLGLGLVWTPCVGPIMASVISLALSRKIDSGSVAITLAYTLGTAIPMFAVMQGGRALLAKVPLLLKNSALIQRIFGAVMLAMALVLAMQWDRSLQTAVLRAFPNYGSGLSSLENLAPVKSALNKRSGRDSTASQNQQTEDFRGAGSEEPSDASKSFGSAPAFMAEGPWFNTAKAYEPGPALSLEGLRGKVVLIDFWTYSCVNCVRTLPWLKAWDKAYRDAGFVIVSVHSPEFAFEKVAGNVQKAIADLGVSWPVVMDNSYAQWKAYDNHYWPSHYLIDAQGKVRSWHFGEGDYEKTEAEIRALLMESGRHVAKALAPAAMASQAKTPEIYLGYGRARGFASAVYPVADRKIGYRPSRKPATAEWNLEGDWTIAKEYVEGESGTTLQLGFDALDVYLVAQPQNASAKLRVQIDGQVPGDTEDIHGGIIELKASRMYHLAGKISPGAHVISLMPDSGVRLYSFTFG